MRSEPRPFGCRISVQTVDEVSGDLIVVRDQDDSEYRSGVVLEVGQCSPLLEVNDFAGVLEPGMIVHFRRGVNVGSVWIVDLADVLAYESL